MRTLPGYVQLIDEEYKAARDQNLSRFSVEWGIWSREMNIETRERIKADDPESVGLKYVFQYWVLTSQLLELHHKYPRPYKKEVAKKRAARDRARIRKIILTGNGMQDVKFEDIQRLDIAAILKGKL